MEGKKVGGRRAWRKAWKNVTQEEEDDGEREENVKFVKVEECSKARCPELKCAGSKYEA